MDKNMPIMVFHIKINTMLISEFNIPGGGAAIIPFTGEVESDLFTGTILPGAADVQISDPAGYRHMCAKYMFQGRDRDGKECYLFVENNGCYRPGHNTDGVIHACPRFITDSAALAAYLSASIFRTEVHPTRYGVEIRVFDINLEDT